MKSWMTGAGAMAMVVALSGPVSAQWPTYRIPDVPTTADGKPDLDAPPPRTADGKPDLSGVWRANAFPQQKPVEAVSGVPQAGFRDVGMGFTGGLPFRPWAAELLKQRIARDSKDNPEAHCLPMGIMQFHSQGMPRKFVQTPRVIVILYEASAGMRQIFTDGRALPPGDPQPWWYGYSVGRWEGETLVVETGGLRDDGWLDIVGSPLTSAARLTERFRRVSYGRMEVDVTVDDPKAYTRPWTVRINQQLMPYEEIFEFICLENQHFGTPAQMK